MNKTYEIVCMMHVTIKRVNPFNLFEFVYNTHRVTDVVKNVDSYTQGIQELKNYTSTVKRDKSFVKWIYVVEVYALRTTYVVGGQKLQDFTPARECRYIVEVNR